MAKQLFLSSVTVDEAWRRWLDILPKELQLPPEPVAVAQALGRVTAAPVFALRSVPHYLAAAMDGIAVKAEMTVGADPQSPLRLTPDEQFVWIDTGDGLPAGFDAVIMIEELHQLPDGSVEIVQPSVAWQHVRGIGEDVVQSDLLLPRYQRLEPADLALLAAAGLSQVTVFSTPRVAVIPTGDELVAAGSSPEDGQVVESNSLLLGGMLSQWGAEPLLHAIVPDEREALSTALLTALDKADIVILNAGSSHGRDDYAADLMRSLGEVAVHGVATKPGKPVILGCIKGKPVIGVPGYPVSAALVLDLFLHPLLLRLLHQPAPTARQLDCRLTRRIVSAIGNREFVRVQVGRVGEEWVATPLGRGAGVLTSLVKSDGVLIVPERSEGFTEGAKVLVNLRKSEQELAAKVVCIGSHDIALDLLSDAVRRQHPEFCLASAHVGSLAGLLALRRGEAHLAGTHLFDPASNEYNVSYLQRLFPAGGVTLVNLVLRQQGLICRPELAERLHSLADVAAQDLLFVNRQRGAGTRVLTEYLLEQAGLSQEQLRGFLREETSHLNVAAAVKGGAADVGMGILAAAKAFGLSFVPLVLERYDLAILSRFLQHSGVKQLLMGLKSADFRQEVAALGGYRQDLTGQVIWGEADA